MKKKCPKCENDHEKTGTYCSHSCANSRTWSKATIEKRAASNKAAYARLSPEQKQKLAVAKQITRTANTLKRDFGELYYDSKRLRVILDQDGNCNQCGLDTWLGQSLRLEIEHKDGNHDNNTRDNLEALCPNCHSLTETWRGKTTERQWKKVQRMLQYKRSLVP